MLSTKCLRFWCQLGNGTLCFHHRFCSTNGAPTSWLSIIRTSQNQKPVCICSQGRILTVISRKSGRWRAHLTIWYSLCSVMCNMELNLCLSQSVSLSRQHGIGSSVFSSYNDSRPSMSWKQIMHNHDQNKKFEWMIRNWTRRNLMVLYATCACITWYTNIKNKWVAYNAIRFHIVQQ